jgi:hypothetical protein
VSRLRYIKIDTEGFDRAVVQSMAGVIAVARPYIKTEIYKQRVEDLDIQAVIVAVNRLDPVIG